MFPPTLDRDDLSYPTWMRVLNHVGRRDITDPQMGQRTAQLPRMHRPWVVVRQQPRPARRIGGMTHGHRGQDLRASDRALCG